MIGQDIVLLSFWGKGIEVSSNEYSLLARIADRFGPFLVSSSPQDLMHVSFEISSPGHTRISVGERSGIVSFDGSWPDPSDVIKLLVVQAHPERLFIHASCVSHDGTGLVFAGSSTCGKTTLAIAMAKRGWTVLADDLVPLDVSRRQVLPFPTSPTLRPFTAKLLNQSETPDRLSQHTECEQRLNAIFLLDQKAENKESARDLTSQLRRWTILSKICCGPSAAPNARSAKTLSSYNPEDFNRAPSIAKASHAFALREVMSLTHPPAPPFRETLAAVSDFVEEIPTYYLKGGHLDSTVELILNVAGCQ